jgi:hypothetical protein
MSLIIDESNKEALKEALGIKKLEADVKALQDAAAADAQAASASNSGSDT